MKLVKYPNKILITPCSDFQFETDRPLLKELEKSVREGFGWGFVKGLAAPQIGISKRFFIAEGKLYINPEIVGRSLETRRCKEGCFSLVENKFDYEIKRNLWVILKWQDRGMNWHAKKFLGDAAQVIQHEYDHLQGKLCLQ